MLESIIIKDFAIIDCLTVDFKQGMSVLTGETGAGKSIIIDAVSLLVGGRGSSDFIRYGAEKSILQGLFDITSTQNVQQILDEHGISYENNQLVVHRELHRTGKSIVKLNGLMVTVSTLKSIGHFLVDIHGQHEHQQLMDSANHLALLDTFGTTTLHTAKKAYQEAYTAYAKAKRELKQLMISEKNDSQREVMLKRHIEEIEQVNPSVKEDVLLEKELEELEKQRKMTQALLTLDRLWNNEDSGVRELLNVSQTNVYHVEKDSQTLHNLVEEINQMVDLSDSVSQTIGKLLSFQSFDEERFLYVDERLHILDQLKEKYGNTIDEVLAYAQRIKQEMEHVVNREKYLKQAQEAFIKARECVLEKGEQLTLIRQEKAKELEQAIHRQLSDLYMKQVIFSVVFENVETRKIKQQGLDNVAFFIASNTGEPLKPLDKVASGGELSRMMLALKAIFSKKEGVQTVVFDEIDTGVSGRVAQAIANKMALIAKEVQVLAISHLPQVAACATQHCYVAKTVENERTQTNIRYLTDEERITEIARMIAGEDITPIALQHAKDLLEN